jgi:uncharacterized protein
VSSLLEASPAGLRQNHGKGESSPRLKDLSTVRVEGGLNQPGKVVRQRNLNSELSILSLLLIGFASGVASGLFGIGGGVLIVPGLVYLVGLSQHRATGTSLAVLLPPIGLAAVLEYYRHGNVDLRAAIIVAGALFVGAWVGAVYANQLSGPYLRLAFGVFIVVLGASLILGAMHRLGWV